MRIRRRAVRAADSTYGHPERERDVGDAKCVQFRALKCGVRRVGDARNAKGRHKIKGSVINYKGVCEGVFTIRGFYSEGHIYIYVCVCVCVYDKLPLYGKAPP